jgi:CBS domain-containing membrane protein
MDKWLEVKHIMSRDLVTADPDEKLVSVRQKMMANHIQHVPVVDGSKILGMISKSDIHRMEHHFTLFKAEKALEANRQIFTTMLAEEIMTTTLVKLKESDTVSVALDLFKENLFHALPVVNDHDELVGLVTPLDLLLYAFGEAPGLPQS